MDTNPPEAATHGSEAGPHDGIHEELPEAADDATLDLLRFDTRHTAPHRAERQAGEVTAPAYSQRQRAHRR